MIKITLLLISAILTAAACVWFVQNNGNVDIQWLGYNIEISVALLVLAILVITLVAFFVISALFWLIKIPSNFKQKRKIRIKEKGFESLARGFIAIAEGDTNKAISYSKDAKKNLKTMPAIELLQAQAYQLEGNSAQAKSHYNILLENKNTEILGIKGLVLQAEEEENFKEAIYLAERAKKRDTKLDWVNKLLLRLYKITHDWHKAQIILGDLVKFGHVKKKDVEKDNAILNLCIAFDYNEKGQFDVALKYTKKAFIVLEGYLPAIYALSSLFFKTDNSGKARKVIESAWVHTPNCHLANLYIQLIADLPIMKQLKVAKRLVKINPNSVEGYYVVAKIAIEAGQLDIARDYLDSAISIKESRKLYHLMIDLEKLDSADENKINSLKIKALTLDSDADWKSSEEDLICGNWLPAENYIAYANNHNAPIHEKPKLRQIDADDYVVNHSDVSDNKEEKLLIANIEAPTEDSADEAQSEPTSKGDEEAKPSEEAKS